MNTQELVCGGFLELAQRTVTSKEKRSQVTAQLCENLKMRSCVIAEQADSPEKTTEHRFSTLLVLGGSGPTGLRVPIPPEMGSICRRVTCCFIFTVKMVRARWAALRNRVGAPKSHR